MAGPGGGVTGRGKNKRQYVSRNLSGGEKR